MYEWDEEWLNRRRLETLQSIEEMRWRVEGVTALDDSLLPKTGGKMPGAGEFWDPSSKSYVHAQCLVTSHYVDLEKDYPVGLRQYFKHGSREACLELLVDSSFLESSSDIFLFLLFYGTGWMGSGYI